MGDFSQLPSIEHVHYDVLNSSVFAELVDCQILELTYNWRAIKQYYNKHYSEICKEPFADICDVELLDFIVKYRAMNDPEFIAFMTDQNIVKEGGKINYKTYDNKECRKSLCWTNKTRKLINNKWMVDESKNKKYIVVNNIKVFVGLPVISKKTMTIDSN
jgi:hypothetical protein